MRPPLLPSICYRFSAFIALLSLRSQAFRRYYANQLRKDRKTDERVAAMRTQLARLDQGLLGRPLPVSRSSRLALPAALARHMKLADGMVDAVRSGWDEGCVACSACRSRDVTRLAAVCGCTLTWTNSTLLWS